MTATDPQFDAVIHAPQRLQICALLSRGGDVEFSTLRDGLGVSDATLSKHLKVLGDAEYVDVRKVQQGSGHARTWVKLTRSGQKRVREHFRYLASIAPL